MPPWLSLELTRPWWLLGLLVLPVLLYYFAYSLVDFTRWQKALSLTARTLIVTLLVLSLAGLTFLRTTRETFVVFAVDRSLSVGEAARKSADAFVEEATKKIEPHRWAALPFAATPGRVETPPTPGVSSPTPIPIDEMGTDLAAALEVASAACPPEFVPRIVLLSDGVSTAGDALKAALRGKVAIDTVPLETRPDPEVQLAAVRVPAQVRQGETFAVEVVIDSNRDAVDATIEVFRGPLKVIGETKKLKKGENRFTFTQSVERERLATFTARVRVPSEQDTLIDNNSDFGLVFTAGRPRVLLIESEPKAARDLQDALARHEVDVDLRPARGMPETLADLQNYELLILSNVPATSLTARQMDVARTFVRDLGGGLIMLGGDQSFGLGGYYKTAIEEILPVRSDFEKEKEKPSLAMVLVIDKSGSMGGDKIELAKDAAKGAVELLGPSDKIGILAFDGEPVWVSEMHPCSDKPFVLEHISTIEAGGGTNMAPAMEDALEALKSTTAKLKHVIILTDGISMPGEFEEIAGEMSRNKITASTVSIGAEANQELLQEIARIGGGRYYLAEDASSVPQIFAKETMAASKSAINEQPFLPVVVRPTPSLADLELSAAPFLLGYVVTRPKPTSEVILATEAGDPLLAWWRYGLGMSVAFTSDAKSRWAAEWLGWPDFGKFWAQVVRHSMRQAEAKGTVADVRRRDRKAQVLIDSIDPTGRFLNGATTTLTVIDPSLGSRKVEMTQSAPGRYAADLETSMPGAYHLEFTQTKDGVTLSRQSRGLAVGYSDELRLRPTDHEALKSLSRVSGGRYGVSAATAFAEKAGREARRAVPIWPYLIAAAALLFVLDVALRRIDLVPWLPRRTTVRV